MSPEDIPDEHACDFVRPFLPDPALEMLVRLFERAAITKDEAVKAGNYTFAKECYDFPTRLRRCAKDYCKLFGNRTAKQR